MYMVEVEGQVKQWSSLSLALHDVFVRGWGRRWSITYQGGDL